jgi:hypothetical protein
MGFIQKNELLQMKVGIELTEMRIVFLKRPFHGSSGSKVCPAYKKTGHWSPGITNSPLQSFSFILSTSWGGAKDKNEISYSALDQSIPAGHRRAPVRS